MSISDVPVYASDKGTKCYDDLPEPKVQNRVLVTGSQTWDDRGAIEAALNFYLEHSERLVVVHGDCPKGADAMARQWCEKKKRAGYDVVEERYPAEWERYGRGAGYRRNADMAKLGADVCLAFLKRCYGTVCSRGEGDSHYSHGTTHAAVQAELNGIATVRWTRR
jgi:hypothetical protein